jgi:hypothetical protein
LYQQPDHHHTHLNKYFPKLYANKLFEILLKLSF